MATQTFRERENQQHQKSRDQFRWKEKQKLYSGGEKMRKASGFQGEMRCSEKTVIGNTNISSIKCATRKLKEVPRFSRAKQRQKNWHFCNGIVHGFGQKFEFFLRFGFMQNTPSKSIW